NVYVFDNCIRNESAKPKIFTNNSCMWIIFCNNNKFVKLVWYFIMQRIYYPWGFKLLYLSFSWNFLVFDSVYMSQKINIKQCIFILFHTNARVVFYLWIFCFYSQENRNSFHPFRKKFEELKKILCVAITRK
ncbi:hypothetical protein AD951_02245, partial [Acetobacter malorum]